jgi:hypothetical protein
MKKIDQEVDMKKFGRMMLLGISLIQVIMLAVMPANASLIGDTIFATVVNNNITPGSAVVGAGIEFLGGHAPLNFDFGENTLTISCQFDFGNAGWIDSYSSITFSGFTEEIIAINRVSSLGFGNSTLSLESFSQHSFTLLDATGGIDASNVQFEDRKIVYNIETSSVPTPEPATILLMAFGSGVMGGGIRRLKKKFKK